MVAMDTEQSREELWHRLDNESGRAYEAFKVYMYLPPATRTVVGAWREWTGNPDARREQPFFLRWSHDFAWSERARAHDHHLEVIREEGMENAIKEESARQARQVEQVRGRYYELMAVGFQRAMEYLEKAEFVDHLRPADVVQIMKLHLETTMKLENGASGADSGGSAMVDWSEDEQREVDRILDEIDAEEAQKQSEEGSSEDLGGDHPKEGTEETG
jgi:hypothetical protein